MNKIQFTTKSLLDGKIIEGPISTDDKYILLSLFVGDSREPHFIKERLDILSQVQNGTLTWDELLDSWEVEQFIFAHETGYLECTREMAFLKACMGHNYEPVEMPLRELIELMKEWLAFRTK